MKDMTVSPYTRTLLKRLVEEAGTTSLEKKAKFTPVLSPSPQDHDAQDDDVQDKKHSCTSCQKSFGLRKSLLRHQRQVHGEKTHRCQHEGCDFASARLQNRDRHQTKCSRRHDMIDPAASRPAVDNLFPADTIDHDMDAAHMGDQFDTYGNGLAGDTLTGPETPTGPSLKYPAARFFDAATKQRFSCCKLCSAKFPATKGAALEHALMHLEQPDLCSFHCEQCNAAFDFKEDLEMHRASCTRPRFDASCKDTTPENNDMHTGDAISCAATFSDSDWIGDAWIHDADNEQTEQKRQRLWNAIQRYDYFLMMYSLVTHKDIAPNRGTKTWSARTWATSGAANSEHSAPAFQTKATEDVADDAAELLQNLRLSPYAAKFPLESHRRTGFNL